MRVARWILASGLIVAAAPLFAQTVAVGNCQPKKTSFPKIQQALNATEAHSCCCLSTTKWGRAGGFSLCPGIFLGRYRPDHM
jgi:hypothetical protein